MIYKILFKIKYLKKERYIIQYTVVYCIIYHEMGFSGEYPVLYQFFLKNIFLFEKFFVYLH